MPSAELPAAIAVAAAAIMWGCWWLPLRVIEAGGLAGDRASLALYLAAAACLVPPALLRTRLASYGAGWALIALLGGSSLALWSRSVVVGEVVRVSLLFYLSPVWGTLLAIVALGERLSVLRILSVVLGLGGALVVLGSEVGIPLPRSEGEWLGLAAGVLFALMATAARRFKQVGGLETTLGNFLFAASTSLILLAVLPASPPPAGIDWPAELPLVVASAALLLVPSTWLLMWGASRIDPGRVATLMLLDIAAVAVSAAWLTDEPFGWREAAGCVLIAGAGGIEAGRPMRRRRPSARERPPMQAERPSIS